jgi:Tol biopolymer transport system component
MLPHGFTDGFGDFMPSWSPIGDKIAFVVNVWDFVTNIYIANADGTDRRRFHGCDWWDNSCRLDALNPQFSPDGDKVVFTMFDFVNGRSQVFVKNTDGTGLTLLADSAQTPSGNLTSTNL